jgi:hypothetical protein
MKFLVVSVYGFGETSDNRSSIRRPRVNQRQSDTPLQNRTHLRYETNAVACAAILATALLKLVNHSIEIGIAGAQASCEPVSTAPGNSLAIGEHLKLTGLARRNHGFNAEPLFDEGHETRDLGFVVLSCRAGAYHNFHSVLQFVGVSSKSYHPRIKPAWC